MADHVLECIAALKDEDWAVREDAATLLGAAHDSRAVIPLVALLQDEDRSVREAAVSSLKAIGKPSVVPLADCLSHSDPHLQESAASILSSIADQRIFEPLLGSLSSPNWIVRMHGAKALGLLKDPRAAESLLPLLQDKVKAVREECVHALVFLGDVVVPSLIEGLKHEEWIVRLHAVEALGKLRSPLAIDALLYVMFNDRDSAIRIDAARSLGEIGDPQAVDYLIVVMKDKDLRPVAIEALGKIGEPRAVPALVGVVSGTDKLPDGRIITGCGDQYEEEMFSVEAAVRALGWIKDESAIPVLLQALYNTMVREEAAKALVACGAVAISPLLGILKKERDENILFHVREALKDLGWRPNRLKPISR